MNRALTATSTWFALTAIALSGCDHIPTASSSLKPAVANANACRVSAPFETATFDRGFETKIDGLMAHMMDRGIAPGAVVQITKKGETVFKRAYGFADLEDRKPM